ncbi:hypothetical protein BK652_00640 [Pseudomonas brassicacearum]|uniref:Ig-like domain-containing protein n=1 Tax=Pseudomonas brassicacearum TaxID=930166 RepID=A0A423GHT1_9PSED|nr:hypothetical protein [Pseudomonas brassicacearum]ROM87593.1 hypothetical protein BK652_00640 [Pseudomonas brassicacearum]
MSRQTAACALALTALSTLCAPAHAGTWQICRLELHIVEVVKKPYPQLEARVARASPASATVECPQQGSTIRFIPETPDYQSTLPRRQWPAKGQSMRVDYRYLDGVCKGDGNQHPCRIKHYPLAGR